MVRKECNIAVVILNWNGKHFLEEFLPVVYKYSSDNSISIVIADNASSDDSVLYLSKHFSDIRLIQFDKNYGFAGGYNKALNEIDADYYVLLNSDVEVTPNWILPIINFMLADDNISAVMPKIKSFTNKEYFEYAGAAGGFVDKYAYPFCRGRIFDTIEKDKGQYDDVIDINWATGACLFVKAADFRLFGGFDDDFFAHMEEIDLCWRLSNAGKRIVYFPDVEVYHVGGGTLPKSNPFKTYLNHRNNLYMLYKNLPSNRLLRVLFIRLLLDGITSLKYFVKLDFRNVFAILKAHFSFYNSISDLNKKRKINSTFIVNKNTYNFYSRSIVSQYFIKGRKYFSDLK